MNEVYIQTRAMRTSGAEFVSVLDFFRFLRRFHLSLWVRGELCISLYLPLAGSAANPPLFYRWKVVQTLMSLTHCTTDPCGIANTNTASLRNAYLFSHDRNMEDTLAARDKLESVRAARRNAPGASSSLEGSLTANYSHHQKEWALQIRALQNRQVGFLCFVVFGCGTVWRATPGLSWLDARCTTERSGSAFSAGCDGKTV